MSLAVVIAALDAQQGSPGEAKDQLLPPDLVYLTGEAMHHALVVVSPVARCAVLDAQKQGNPAQSHDQLLPPELVCALHEADQHLVQLVGTRDIVPQQILHLHNCLARSRTAFTLHPNTIVPHEMDTYHTHLIWIVLQAIHDSTA